MLIKNRNFDYANPFYCFCCLKSYPAIFLISSCHIVNFNCETFSITAGSFALPICSFSLRKFFTWFSISFLKYSVKAACYFFHFILLPFCFATPLLLASFLISSKNFYFIYHCTMNISKQCS